MENKANYLYVGLFVFGIFFASLFFMVWLSSLNQKESFAYYQIFTKESISGLSIKSPVKLLGVDVGTVEDTSIVTSTEVEARILIKVKENTPITHSTYAKLSSQGITGLKYIELHQDDRLSQPLREKADEIPTIKMKESLFSSLESGGNVLLELLTFTDERLRILFNDENLANFSLLLKNFNELAKDLDKGLNPAFVNLNTFSENMTQLSAHLNSNLELLEELLLNMNEMLIALKQSPSDLLFKSSKNKAAPGE
ncbi:MlaD family protein [Campylobacter troglodytis]|uniref:MlaD family protein n=1 Tax=Campylobacter troglodytis TaxID=654363 RepID=UPI001159E8F6|nr:MlaD family protein [Campylobacter troglodytis]TQR61450.1 MCE family protein [Campylobacter troglodytis]